MTVASDSNEPSDASVRVAVRIRPQNPRERMQMNQICTSVTPNEPQIYFGKDKAFTYDYVFNILSKQEEIFNTLAKPLIDGCLEGYNATILAYGQTGSGKTFTMGSGFDISLDSIDVGIIPRGVQYLFHKIDLIRMDYKRKMLPVPDFKIVAQFLELYNEELIDLLDIHDGKDRKSHIKIHENTGGSIYLTGVSTRLVSSLDDTLKCLKDGTLCRSTASTNMNSTSSRSHAIFTLHIKQQRLIDSDMNENPNGDNENDYETLTAKFHFVDLAGSERLKRTGATGERAKEGISINCGLLALGNVISTLGDKTKRGSHVPYRNSKLTRLLQDSLGGNSQTIMIACISPSDCDFLETLNTLNYANRARNIKNKLTVNQDKTSKQLAAMRMQIESLQAELLEYKQGKKSGDSKDEAGFSDIYLENNILQNDNQSLRLKIKALAETIETLKARNAQILAEKEAFLWQVTKQSSNFSELNLLDLESDEIMKVIEKYTLEVEDLRAKCAESEAMVNVLQRSNAMSNHLDYSRQSHISMTGEFPDDESIFESNNYEWDSFVGRSKHRKIKRSDPSNDILETSPNLVGSMQSESGDLGLPALVVTSDVDKDSLNGDADEGSNAEDSLDEDEDDDSDAENHDTENYLHQSLATLSTEIDVKKRLISELQAKQKQLKKIREHYETQLEALQNRIKETENERDQVLANLGEVEVNNEERVRRVKTEYERKLADMKSELNQLQTAKREHTIMLKNQQRKDHELRLLQKELNDLKGMKVQLSKKLREETKRTRIMETSRNKEIVQLRKEKRIADNQIKNLENEKTRKNQILKRKQEEVEALRRRQNQLNSNTNRMRQIPVSAPHSKVSTKRPGSQLPKAHARRNSLLARLTRSKWNSIENALKKTIIRRQTINSFEQDMNTRVKEREKLGFKYQKLDSRRNEFLKEGKSIDEIIYELKNIKSQIESVQEEITECQSNILEVEESQLEESVSDIIANCSLDEAQFLLEQVYQLAINKGILAQTLEIQESSLKFQLETRSQEREQALDMLRIALQHSTVPFEMDGIFANESEEDDDYEETVLDSDIPNASNLQSRNLTKDQFQMMELKKTISKRKPATPEELLGVSKTPTDKSLLNFNFENNNNSSLTTNAKRNIHTAHTPTETSKGLLINSAENWRDSSENEENKSQFPIPKTVVRRQLTWKHPGGSMTTSLIVSRNNPVEEIPQFSAVETPPASPLNFRRSSSQRSSQNPPENVFKRLTTTRSSPNPTKGTIIPVPKKSILPNQSPLQCVSIAEGHHKAILDLDVSGNILITGSKDRCAKIWDLSRLIEVGCLTEHQNSVTKVRFSSATNLAFTVSTFYIKMWDIRDCKKCIRTLWSSGLSQEGPPEFSQTSRQTVCPPGENFIMDIAFSNGGNTMFLATANSVKLWDMRRYSAVGKLHGNHQAPVMVLAASDRDRCSSTLVTGSKDHYIKVFEVSTNSVGMITPSVELQPPHYDGVESLALVDQTLLSGSRDACIKKWDLATAQPVASFSQAHRDWIQALCFTEDAQHFLSGCRSGVVKLWSTDNCIYLGDVQAHDSGITALRASSDRVFSSSSDCKVKIWKRSDQ